MNWSGTVRDAKDASIYSHTVPMILPIVTILTIVNCLFSIRTYYSLTKVDEGDEEKFFGRSTQQLATIKNRETSTLRHTF